MPARVQLAERTEAVSAGVRVVVRRHSYLSDAVARIICGLGLSGYRLAYEAALERAAAGAR